MFPYSECDQYCKEIRKKRRELVN